MFKSNQDTFMKDWNSILFKIKNNLLRRFNQFKNKSIIDEM